MEIEREVATLKADVAVLRMLVNALLTASPARSDIIAALQEEAQTALSTLQSSGVADVSASELMQARARLFHLVLGLPPRT